MRRAAMVLTACIALGGCIAYTAASTAVSVTATVVETTVDVAAGGVDLLVGGDDEGD